MDLKACRCCTHVFSRKDELPPWEKRRQKVKHVGSQKTLRVTLLRLCQHVEVKAALAAVPTPTAYKLLRALTLLSTNSPLPRRPSSCTQKPTLCSLCRLQHLTKCRSPPNNPPSCTPNASPDSASIWTRSSAKSGSATANPPSRRSTKTCSASTAQAFRTISTPSSSSQTTPPWSPGLPGAPQRRQHRHLPHHYVLAHGQGALAIKQLGAVECVVRSHHQGFWECSGLDPG